MPNPNDSRRFKNIWPFSKPKTPGFGISAHYYLSVLASVARLPPILSIVNPQGDGGAVVGFGAPLSGPTDRSALSQPISRGIYAIASQDRKNVLKMMVLPKEEVGFDPEPVLRSSFGASLSAEAANRIRATWTLIQLSFESHDPAVYPALDLILDIAARMGQETEGAIADPMSEVYRLPQEVRAPHPPPGPVDARNFVSIRSIPTTSGIYAFTLGLQKFSLPEIEISGLQPGQETAVNGLLIGLSQTILLGNLLDGIRFSGLLRTTSSPMTPPLTFATKLKYGLEAPMQNRPTTPETNTCIIPTSSQLPPARTRATETEGDQHQSLVLQRLFLRLTFQLSSLLCSTRGVTTFCDGVAMLAPL